MVPDMQSANPQLLMICKSANPKLVLISQPAMDI
jgi:hypothetical protein